MSPEPSGRPFFGVEPAIGSGDRAAGLDEQCRIPLRALDACDRLERGRLATLLVLGEPLGQSFERRGDIV
jgi:hypothetical protein